MGSHANPAAVEPLLHVHAFAASDFFLGKGDFQTLETVTSRPGMMSMVHWRREDKRPEPCPLSGSRRVLTAEAERSYPSLCVSVRRTPVEVRRRELLR